MATHTYIFMRHGEAEHNVAAALHGDKAYEDPAYRDAPLTAKGREQILESARELQKTYPKIDLIFSSPLTRTIQTARCVKEIIPCAEKIILLECLTECPGGNHICNLRLEMPLLQSLNPDTDARHISPYTEKYNDSYLLTCPRKNLSDMLWSARFFGGYMNRLLPQKTKGNSTILIVSHHETLNAWFGKSLKNGEYIVAKSLSEIRLPTD